MSEIQQAKTLVQKIGIFLFSAAMALFVLSLTMSHYELDITTVKEQLNNPDYNAFIDQNAAMMQGKSYGSSFSFLNDFDAFMKKVQADVKTDLEAKGLGPSDGSAYWNSLLQDYKLKGLRFPVTKASSQGFLPDNWGLMFLLTIVLGTIGALMYILPKRRFHPGIKNNGVFQSSMHNLGWLGLVTGAFLIGFYILLYFFPEHMVNWVKLVDPVSMAIKGQPASNWFLYGFLYTIAILVMGVRMILKYRHNRYQMLRTGSVMFFQLTFAFMLPEIMTALNMPSVDLKNIWPLDYSFFFDYRINDLIGSGKFGIFLLFWGLLLTIVGVPLITYFVGKRWYCSWVCGCGGLAETLGDPYRQLSDKSVQAWQIERWTIHSVLVFAVIMTIIVLYGYFPTAADTDSFFNKTNFTIFTTLALIGVGAYIFIQNKKAKAFTTASMWAMIAAIGAILVLLNYNHFIAENYKPEIKLMRWHIIALAAAIIGGLVALHRREHPDVPARKIVLTALVFFGAIAFWQWIGYMDTEKMQVTYNHYDVRSIYGFSISSIFAGVVGTGFYPIMGSRAWCRFGCPLAAYLGIVQKLKSRFRITTNGSQCISCGNCSTYCEMGIDVRAYAQKGQDIVRASCVGCGVCSAVCPRGVLRLENASADVNIRAMEQRAIHITDNEIKLVG